MALGINSQVHTSLNWRILLEVLLGRKPRWETIILLGNCTVTVVPDEVLSVVDVLLVDE